jgi:hypothetical protein
MAIATIGAKLKYDKQAVPTEITGLTSIPALGGKREKIEVTTLTDTVKKTIFGIRDLGDLEFKFIFDNSSATANYRVLKGLEDAGAAVAFTVEFIDGTKFAFSAYVSVEVGEAQVNKAHEFSASMALTTAITVTNPV